MKQYKYERDGRRPWV